MKNTRSTSGSRARTRELGYADAMADVYRHTRRLLNHDEAGTTAIAEEIMQYASPVLLRTQDHRSRDTRRKPG